MPFQCASIIKAEEAGSLLGKFGGEPVPCDQARVASFTWTAQDGIYSSSNRQRTAGLPTRDWHGGARGAHCRGLNEATYRSPVRSSNALERIPEGVLEAQAGLTESNNYNSLQ
jgi:hypothetical protein